MAEARFEPRQCGPKIHALNHDIKQGRSCIQFSKGKAEKKKHYGHFLNDKYADRLNLDLSLIYENTVDLSYFQINKRKSYLRQCKQKQKNF